MPITADEARFVGDAVAMVVAETREQARDAAELVEVDWEPLEAVAGWRPRRGRATSPPTTTWATRPRARRHSRRRSTWCACKVVNQRVIANPLEPRALAAQYDAAAGRYTLWCPTQNVHNVRAQLATALKVKEDELHIVCTDIGGGFGARGYAYPEHAALLWAARKLGRPLRWLADRSEHFLAEVHGRDNVTVAELAIDAEQRFTALRIRTLANVGAYISSFGAAVPAMSGARAPTGVYAIPVLDHEVKMMFTNTSPVDAYRGAGRPEMGYLLERLVERAAMELGVDAVELRLKNMVPAARMPYANPAGLTYDCGDFATHAARGAGGVGLEWLRRAQGRSGEARPALRPRPRLLRGDHRQRQAERDGARRGARPMARWWCTRARRRSGRGCGPPMRSCVAEKLGIDPQAIRVVQGDSDLPKTGGGAGGSRGLQVGGSAALAGAAALIEAARPLAAQALEAAAADLEYGEGRFRIAGTDRGIGLFELAGKQPGAAHRLRAHRDGEGPDLAERLPGGRGRGGSRNGRWCASRATARWTTSAA